MKRQRGKVSPCRLAVHLVVAVAGHVCRYPLLSCNVSACFLQWHLAVAVRPCIGGSAHFVRRGRGASALLASRRSGQLNCTRNILHSSQPESLRACASLAVAAPIAPSCLRGGFYDGGSIAGGVQQRCWPDGGGAAARQHAPVGGASGARLNNTTARQSLPAERQGRVGRQGHGARLCGAHGGALASLWVVHRCRNADASH